MLTFAKYIREMNKVGIKKLNLEKMKKGTTERDQES